MIANITSGSDFSGAIMYHENRQKNEQGAFLYAHNMVGNNPQNWINQLQIISSESERIEKPVIHISLNLHLDDKVDTNKFREMADDYMREMGYGNQPYVVYRHFHTNHDHIHIISSRVGENGKKINDSFERERSQRKTAELEVKHGITLVNHDFKTGLTKEIKADENSLSRKLRENIEKILKITSPTSEKELSSILKRYSIGFESNEVGSVFYSLNPHGERDSCSIPGNKIINGEELREKFQFNGVGKKDKVLGVRNRIVDILSRYEKISEQDFAVKLFKADIEVQWQRNSGGIYGVTFFDKKSGYFFKGSELSRNELSWNNLKDTVTENETRSSAEIQRVPASIYSRIRKGLVKQYYFESQLLQNVSFDDMLDLYRESLNTRGIDEQSDVYEQLMAEGEKLLNSKYLEINKIETKERRWFYGRVDRIEKLSSYVEARYMESVFNMFDISTGKNNMLQHNLKDDLVVPGPQSLSIIQRKPDLTKAERYYIKDIFRKLILVKKEEGEKDYLPYDTVFLNNKPYNKILNDTAIGQIEQEITEGYIKSKIDYLTGKGPKGIDQQGEELLTSLNCRGIMLMRAGDDLIIWYRGNKEGIKAASILSESQLESFKEIDLKNSVPNKELRQFSLIDRIDKGDIKGIKYLIDSGVRATLPASERKNLPSRILTLLDSKPKEFVGPKGGGEDDDRILRFSSEIEGPEPEIYETEEEKKRRRRKKRKGLGY